MIHDEHECEVRDGTQRVLRRGGGHATNVAVQRMLQQVCSGCNKCGQGVQRMQMGATNVSDEC
jgi:hypothetical protein